MLTDPLRATAPLHALVVSPFATTPRDAGHRRRVWQMTRLLAQAGYSVTFLLFAFEEEWAWRHDTAAAAAMRAEWDELIVVHAGQHVGRPPAAGTRHGLDEWWDPALESTLANLATRRAFDVVVVHNVWLSKAFDFVHPAAVRVIETHDLFWKRDAAFGAIGRPVSFFAIDRQSEIFGLSRADILVTIQANDAHELLPLTDRRIVNVPFYDPSLEAEIAPASLQDPDITRFGVLASDNPFNAHGINALIEAVDAEVARSFAPIEIVVGGRLGTRVPAGSAVRCVGSVASERQFYAGVDYAIAPVFAGTGFKIKTGDALALGRPLLAASHAACGTAIDRKFVFDTPREMAARMAEIALHRPDPRGAQSHALRARDALKGAAESGSCNLLRAIAHHKSTLVVDLHDTTIEHSALKLQGWTGMAREFAQVGVILLLPEDIRQAIGRLLPPGIRAMTLAAYEVNADRWPRRVMVDATDGGALRHCDHRDTRWRDDEPAGPLLDIPLLHPNVTWEPAARRLRALWCETPTAQAQTPQPGLLLIRSNPGAPSPPSARLVDAGCAPAVNAALMRLLCDPPRLVVVASSAAPRWARRASLEVCAVAGIGYRGLVDAAALAPDRAPVCAPGAVARELAARIRVGAVSLMLPKDPSPCHPVSRGCASMMKSS